jgi:hypothetical protein
MVRQDFGMVFDSTERFHPFRSRLVLLSTVSPRQLIVGDVADQRVHECVFGVLRHRRAW